MVYFAPAKINIGLQIKAKRPDGYHEIESLIYPIAWRDALEVLPATAQKSTELNLYGLRIGGPKEDNLVFKAWQLMADKYPRIGQAMLYLHKVVPFGAGLGGGSSDAAATLQAINEVFELGLKAKDLEAHATELGSDCPFFIQNKPALATGRGEVLKEHPISLPWSHLTVVYPNVLISSKKAYGLIEPKVPEENLTELLGSPKDWKDHLKNDFEPSVFKQHPQLAELKAQLYTLGAGYASLSGSGSALFAFSHEALDISAFLKKGYKVWQQKPEGT